MFRSSNIIRELVQSLAKVVFLLKRSLKLRRYMLRGDVAADMLPHLHVLYNDVILLNVLTEI